MRLQIAIASFFGLCLLSACQQYKSAMNTLRENISMNIAIVNSDNYLFIRNSHCSITTDMGDTITTQLNPDTVLLTTNIKSLSIDCRAPGYTQKSIAITNTIGKWSAQDLFMLPPGDIVDTANSLLPYYPSHIVVLMNKKPFTNPKQTESTHQQAKQKDLLFQGTS